MTGRMVNEKVAKLAWVFIFIGFNITFFTMFILGLMGMPRRYAEYLPQQQGLNIVATVGSWILAVGVLIMVGNFIRDMFHGAQAPANPWHSKTLEWQTASPPATENFEEIPVVTEWPYSYGKKKE